MRLPKDPDEQKQGLRASQRLVTAGVILVLFFSVAAILFALFDESLPWRGWDGTVLVRRFPFRKTITAGGRVDTELENPAITNRTAEGVSTHNIDAAVSNQPSRTVSQ